MNSVKAKIFVAVALPLCFLSGCATHHQNLLTNDQLVAASCSELSIEESKVAENIAAAKEGASVGAVGSVFLAFLEVAAAGATKTQFNPQNSGTVNVASLSDENTKKAAELESRKNMISLIRNKKGCR